MDAETKLFVKKLKQNRLFVTAARKRLFSLLQQHTSLTIPELISKTDAHDQATVYRNIKTFERLGIISRVRLGSSTKLELSDIFRHHHHHFSCISCGKVMVLKQDRELENQIDQLLRKGRFKPVDHQLEVRGICPACQKV